MFRVRSCLVALLLGILLAGIFVSASDAADLGDKDKDVLRTLSRAIAKVAGDVSPAVVSIYTTKTIRMRDAPDFFDLPFPFDPLDDFFRGRRRSPRGPEPRERKFRSQGLGSGFIVDAEKGYILTNNHVIDQADDIKVRLADKREFDAKLVGADKQTDLAVIQIKANNLRELKLGDSDKLQVGEFVIAVGSPFGLRETVTFGIVSGKGRSNLYIEDYEDFIQTDAAINMGNSGGPLVNIEGEVVGVNTAIFSRTGGSVGVGFAIPANMAKSIFRQLVDSGKVTRGRLGVMIQDVTPDMVERLGLERPAGALVSQVIEGSPAAKAKIEVGDVIIEFGKQKIENVAQLRTTVAATPPGTKVDLTVIRDKKRKTLTVEVDKLTDDAVAQARGGVQTRSLGLSVQNLTPELAENLGLKAKTGVVVTEVDEDGPAADKGVKRGDVILEVDRQAVNDVAAFQAALEKADLEKGVLLLVADEQGSRFVVLKKKAEKK